MNLIWGIIIDIFNRNIYDSFLAKITLKRGGKGMTNSVYKVIELVGTSDVSWEEAAKNAMETASKTLKNIRIVEVNKLDMKVENGNVIAFRARVSLSFKIEKEI